ncbi:virion structural protein [Vibrio phage C-ZP2022]|nr:virion structural protein [Vibrio phage C-ZP2022]
MVYIIDAFAEIQSLISNDNKVTTPAGELSPRAKAYTRDLRTYSDPGVFPGTTIHVFSCKQNETDVAVPLAGVSKAMDIAHQISLNYTGGSTGRTFLEDTFNDLYSVAVGSDVPVSGKTLIDHIEVNFDVGGNTFLLRLYMASAYFEANYKEYEIAVVPPIFPVTQLQDTFTNVVALLNNVDPTDIAALESDTIGKTPASHRTVYRLRWKDADNNQINTFWTIIGWGAESMRTDVILQAIRDYLTLNSGSSIDTWRNYLPDIQVEDNFTFVPLWDQEAVSAGNGIDAYYRPILNMGEAIKIGAENFQTRNATEWAEQGEMMTIFKKSLPMVVIGGLGNSNEERLFSTMYNDYTMFMVNEPVSGHVSNTTKTAIQTLETLAMLAESYSGVTVLPGNITRNVINNKTFLETAVDGMLFKMLVKADYVRP